MSRDFMMGKKIKNPPREIITREHFKGQPSLNLKLPFNLSALTYLASNIDPLSFPDGLMWFLNNQKEKDQVINLFKFWSRLLGLNTVVNTFPENFFKFIAKDSPRGWLIGSSEHLALPLPEPSRLVNAILRLKPKEKINPTILLKLLDKLGYQPGPLNEPIGWYLKHGGLIEIGLTDDQILILEFTDNQIENLSRRSLITGLSEKIIEAVIPPLTIKPSPITHLADYLNKNQLLFCPPISKKFGGKLISRLTANPFQNGQSWLESTPLFAGRWEDIGRYINKELDSGFKIHLLTAEPVRTERLLKQTAKLVTIHSLSEEMVNQLDGFKDKLNNIIWLTDRNLTWQQKSYGTSFVYLPLDHLRRGDYLVHIDHGIGRFLNLVNEGIEHLKHDYFVIEYADRDKLYVPVENADRLSRYIGQPHPKLHRLHGMAWYQVTKKIKEDAGKVARELLELYAKRTMAKIVPWQKYAEEENLAAAFPWPLTSDQLKAWAEISSDLEKETPMDRLICGDVGFGKTELAVRAAFRSVLNGQQVALLCSTTILAQQHYDTFSKRLKSWPIKIALLNRLQDQSVIKTTVKQIANGQTDIIIGTHRVLSKDITIPNLGLLIVDEEQRFGVKQKEVLKKLKPSLRVLSLSATPIPRTLHITLSELRDLSLITTPPWGRKPIQTIFSPHDDKLIRQAINQELKRHGQIYYLVNRIAKIPATGARLQKIMPKIKIGVAHGRLPEKELAGVMHNFDVQKIDLLLATTIIENGLDLPNVNTLIVDDSENFGLSDLYQMRGRIGRNDKQAFAYFFFNHEASTPMAQKRLAVLAEAKELGAGMQVALKDMELRGAGSILGTEQHGQIAAVGLHMYSRLIAQAIEELKTGQPLPEIPEVTLRLPLEGKIDQSLVPDENERIKLYHKLANIRNRDELKSFPEELLKRPLGANPADMLFKNLITLLDLKLLAESARLTDVQCHPEGGVGNFEIKFARVTKAESIAQLLTAMTEWKFSTDILRAEHNLNNDDWINWLESSLILLGK